jgi:hypothetical protein
MWFITSILVVSAFGLPAVLCRSHVVRFFFETISEFDFDFIQIELGAMGFIMAANVVIFSTIIIYFLSFGSDDDLTNY